MVFVLLLWRADWFASVMEARSNNIIAMVKIYMVLWLHQLNGFVITCYVPSLSSGRLAQQGKYQLRATPASAQKITSTILMISLHSTWNSHQISNSNIPIILTAEEPLRKRKSRSRFFERIRFFYWGERLWALLQRQLCILDDVLPALTPWSS